VLRAVLGGHGVRRGRARPSAARRPRCATRTRSPKRCATATLCDADALAQALRDGTLGTPGTLKLTLDGAVSASAPGVVQAVGAPLEVRQTLRVEGAAATGAQLLVRAQDADEVTSARYERLGLAGGGSLTVQAVSSGGHVGVHALDAAGRTLRPVELVRAPSTRRPTRPGHVRARRRGARVRITLNRAHLARGDPDSAPQDRGSA
jgi:hypothetical protein